MISITFLTVFVSCLACAFGEPQEQPQSEPSTTENPSKLLTEVGYIRYGDPFYIYPTPNERRFLSPSPKNPTETNEIESQESNSRPLFIFTTSGSPLTSSQKQEFSQSGPFIEIRRKRDVSSDAAVTETSFLGKLRPKRSHCKKCGGGGYGYAPVSYAVYPVYTAYVQPSYQPAYYPSYGGGCNTCGHGGGGGGSYSYSSSSSKSSSGSWGYGK